MKHQNDDRTQRRLQILSEDEIEAMYDRPLFNHEDRVHYFSLSALEKAALKQFHTFQSRIFYIVQLGYFKGTPAILHLQHSGRPRRCELRAADVLPRLSSDRFQHCQRHTRKATTDYS